MTYSQFPRRRCMPEGPKHHNTRYMQPTSTTRYSVHQFYQQSTTYYLCTVRYVYVYISTTVPKHRTTVCNQCTTSSLYESQYRIIAAVLYESYSSTESQEQYWYHYYLYQYATTSTVVDVTTSTVVAARVVRYMYSIIQYIMDCILCILSYRLVFWHVGCTHFWWLKSSKVGKLVLASQESLELDQYTVKKRAISAFQQYQRYFRAHTESKDADTGRLVFWPVG